MVETGLSQPRSAKSPTALATLRWSEPTRSAMSLTGNGRSAAASSETTRRCSGDRRANCSW